MIIVYVFMFLSVFVALVLLYSFFEGVARDEGGLSDTDKKVTFLIPAYNEGKSIARTIECALAQDYPRENLEIIVVDDGSEDDTYAIAKQYEKEGVIVYTKQNQGKKAFALNFGLKHVTGDYIFELDADMYPRPDTLRKMLWYFKDPKVMGVAPSMHIWRPKGFWLKLQVFEYTLASFIRKGLQNLGALNVTPGASLYRKSFIDKHGGFASDNLVEDFEMGMRINSKGYKVAHAINTRVDVVSPKTFKVLFKQRVRWAYGHYQIFKKYGFMFGFKHGDLGFFYLPVSILFMFTPFFMFLRMIYKYVNHWFFKTSMFSEIGYDFSYSFANYKYNYTYQPYHFIVFVSLATALITYFAVKKIVAPDYGFGPMFVLYLFFYLLLLALFNISAAVYYVRKKEPSWTAEKRAGIRKRRHIT